MLHDRVIETCDWIVARPDAVDLIRRIGRYGCVGFVVSAFYSIAVILFVDVIIMGPTVASLLAFVLTLPAGYVMHRRVTFFDRSSDACQPLRFTLSNVASFAVSVGGMYWVTAIDHDNYLVSIGWNYALIPAINFILYIAWVFRPSASSKQATP